MPSDHERTRAQAIVYARYSSDHQRDASIEDQISSAGPFIERQGWVYQHAYVDRALSGASTVRPGYQLMLEGRARAGSTWWWPRRSTASPATRRTWRRSTSGSASPASPRNPGRGRDHRSPRRAQGHHECPLPQGPRRQDPPRAAGPGRGGRFGRRHRLWLRRRAQGRPGRYAGTRRAADQSDRGRGRAADLRGLRRRALGPPDRPRPQRGGRPRRRGGRAGARPRSAATPTAATASSTTSSTSAGWSGTGSASSRTRRPASGCRATSRGRSGWYRRCRSCGSWTRSCGRGSRRARRRALRDTRPEARLARATGAGRATCSRGWCVCGACGGGYTKISANLFGCATARNKGAAVCDNLLNIRRDRSRTRCSMRCRTPDGPGAVPGVLRRVRARDQSGARR